MQKSKKKKHESAFLVATKKNLHANNYRLLLHQIPVRRITAAFFQPFSTVHLIEVWYEKVVNFRRRLR